MFLGLWHWTVRGTDHENRTVHLGSTGDHVLDKVGVTRAVDVSIVTFVGFVFNVRNSDRHSLGFVANGTTLGNVSVRLEYCQAFCSLNGQQRSSQR